ncbi:MULTISPECIES: transporter substrate-binding domain-containing protein [Streptomyces]|uniref:Transporter substrate-binding domain-containing protein n=1 Tax=Streptomyces doudnae TaxID=3075536 RepID=A0ABD5EGB1_9ACTN|nr:MULTISPECIES: transporter substrate-binding domain-containing protein [unclassified Streptomyces]MDT0433320.1 transporter substrate-binding domain-containing protein [Streptomyces sp. DSM 41981]SCE42936.1 amino acid ABC transporter substrate-binding protein, PAAT family [Streptomyces sp. SolWspMP-5a-2]
MNIAGRSFRTIRVGAAMVAFAGVALAGCSSEHPSLFAEGRIEVGSKSDQPGTSYSPHDGEFTGFDITVAREVLRKVGIETPDFEGVLSENRASDLHRGDIQLVAATYSITAERMAPKSERGDGLDFVGPYASTQQGILVRTEDAEQYQRMSDFNGKLVCVWKGTTSAAELKREAYSKIGLAVETDARTCVRRLRDKTIDAVSTDQLILYGFMEDESGFAVVHSLTFGAFNDYGIAMVKGHREDCRKLQDALMEYARSNDWDRDFQNDLPKVPKAIRDEARPTEDDIDRYSCRDRPGNAQAAD